MLKNLGSAGFRWVATIDNPEIVKVERLVDSQRLPGPLPGSRPSEEWQVTALAPGETVVRFAQTRSFEPDKPANDTYEVLVKVL